MTIPATGPLPFSYPVRVETITLRPVPVEIAPDPANLPAIARQIGVASLEALKAAYTLSRNGEKLQLRGTIEAALHQTCVVSVEAFPVALKVPLKLDFAPQAEPDARKPEDDDEIDLEIMLNEEDPPEPIVDGMIDLGAVTLEFLTLALDPYPRKPGVDFAEIAPETAVESPFAALARLKRED